MYLACNFCVGVGNVAWELAGGKRLAGGVFPGAGEVIACADKLKIGTGGEGGQGVAAIEHISHVCHLTGIKGRHIQTRCSQRT